MGWRWDWSGLAEGLSAARLLAARGNYRRPDQELIATGAANLGSGLSAAWGGGFAFKTAAAERATPAPRSPASERPDRNGRHRLAGGALSTLPKAVLSPIVIRRYEGLMDVAALRRYRQIRRNASPHRPPP